YQGTYNDAQQNEAQENEEQGCEGQGAEEQESEERDSEGQENEEQENEEQDSEGQKNERQESEEQEAENTVIRLYKIENISVICAVAVQQEGSDSWYPAVNTGYCPETLGQFVEDLDLTNTLPIDWFYYHQETDTESWSYIGPADEEEAEKVKEVITSRPRAKNEPGLEHERTTAFVSVSTSLPLLGYENENARGYVKIEVYEDGYLMISFEELGEYYFYIGESKAQKFIRYMGQSVDEA
ncbi:MAG: hypothetical protein LUE29_10340, partial [Lachnospiraceae bacterium]|nr:hypothetical protein [Lachnospiraceae bacterium]